MICDLEITQRRLGASCKEQEHFSTYKKLLEKFYKFLIVERLWEIADCFQCLRVKT